MYTQYTSDTNHPKHFQDAEGGWGFWKKREKKYKVTFENKDNQPICHPSFTIYDETKWKECLGNEGDNVIIDNTKSKYNEMIEWYNPCILTNGCNIILDRNKGNEPHPGGCNIILDRNKGNEPHPGGTVTFMYDNKKVAIAELEVNIQGFIGVIERLIDKRILNQLALIKDGSTFTLPP